MPASLPALFVPHGAPTLALTPGDTGLALSAMAARLPRPRAIIVASAHWQSDVPVLGCAECLETIHDFTGFPPALREIRYPARGSRELANRAAGLLRAAGLATRLDERRGLDHGAWIPLRIMYPAADIPVLPLSILVRGGPAAHLSLGRALAPLLREGILLLASGNLTHNLYDYRLGGDGPAYVGEFAQWFADRLAAGDPASLADYRRQAPAAARAHPEEEHLLPLFLALGAAGAGWRAERFHSGIAERVLAMDAYAFWPQETGEERAGA